MNFTFLNPMFLYGLTAATIPLLIHLINRRRAKLIRFPAVQFVILSDKRVARKYKIRQWLLLLLRTAAILIFVLTLARPVLTSPSDLPAQEAASSAILFILDNSLSMGYQTDQGVKFDMAREAIRTIVGDLESGVEVGVIPVSSSGEVEKLTKEKERILNRIAEIDLSYRPVEFAQAFQDAFNILKESSASQKEIIFVTDFARVGWEQFSTVKLSGLDPSVKVRIIWVGNPAEDTNVALKEVALENQIFGSGMTIFLDAKVKNFGGNGVSNLPVRLILDGKPVDQRLINLSRFGETTVRFNFSFEQPGHHFGAIQLAPDHFPLDDAFHFTLTVGEKVTALIVDGDPQTSLIASETFYVSNALNPEKGKEGTILKPRVATVEQLEETDFKDLQVIILCNVRDLSEATRQRLTGFVRNGGGLMIFLGDKVNALDYNAHFFSTTSSLIPVRLRERVRVSGPGGVSIRDISVQHKALNIFEEDKNRESLISAKFQEFFAIERSEGIAGITPLLMLSNGHPLLIERGLGSGKILLFTSSADLDWNDLGLRAAYLPLLHNVILYLSGRLERLEKRDLIVGESKEFSGDLQLLGKPLEVTNPRKERATLWFESYQGKVRALYTKTDIPGVYRGLLPASEELFAINFSREESNFERISEEEIREKFFKISVNLVKFEGSQSNLLASIGQNADFSKLLFFGLFCLIALEGIVASRV
ncbi:MAG: BatA domain-containing protein [Candidatus Tectomicrobia bacterium]|nr:BatA domain-containing protein [Candidatus Tectomicrobia bacterium]